MVTVQQESIPAESCEAEIPRITFTIRNTSLGPRHWGPGGGDFFQLFYSSRGRSVSIPIDDNLALLVRLLTAAASESAAHRCRRLGWSPRRSRRGRPQRRLA